MNYNIVTEFEDSTVVHEYEPILKKHRTYQSEADLENNLINLLVSQGYEYLDIHNENDLILNLRAKLEKLNNYKFSNDEWNVFFRNNIANPNFGIKEKTNIIQEDYKQVLLTDDGISKNIYLIDKKNIHNNYLQVINQYAVDDGKHPNRYDVTILVNGLPLVHIELKRRGVKLKQAFDQINKYQRDSFWAGSGLYEYVQIFVISNGTNTKYYSNSTRFNHIKNELKSNYKEKTSNSFEFTSFWADSTNKIIPDLEDFAKTFFQKHTLLNIITKYCIFTSEKILLVMRPYQIVATERILNKIEISETYKKYGTIEGGGYIWHTTGSGKTLTSFKTARLATKLAYIDKVLFVVDRKDLDYQTMREYDRFEKGAANSNSSTDILKRQLEDNKSKIIITTIQKLSNFIKKNVVHDIYKKRVVIIFDECHRSQFGDMHIAITKHFKKYNLFGFTGTPIFTVNSGNSKNFNLRTTEQAFGNLLHTYTIIDAINDKNVLPFRVDYIKTISMNEDIEDKQVSDIDREKVYLAPQRIEIVAKYIYEHFDQKTYRNQKSYSHSVVTNLNEVIGASSTKKIEEIKQKQIINGFNSIFAVSSIEAAKLYYNEFKKLAKENPNKKLKIALIYSYAANEAETDELLAEENPEDTINLDQSSRDFLEDAIKDYNEMFGTTFDTSSDKFQNYYKDVSMRMKNKELDMLIVVNMFLTGFDATTLNTLWVDKNLKMHGLIQAYSRTNRILNSIKTFGNIVCFRNLQKRTDEAVALFGDKNAGGIVILKGFKDYYYGYEDNKGVHKKGYVEIVDELTKQYPLGQQITGETNQKEFVKLFGSLLRAKNILVSFDEFIGKEILSDFEFQDYTSIYLDIKDQIIPPNEPENIVDDIIFETELLKTVDINIDYILVLVQKYHDSHCNDKEILLTIQKAVDSSMELRSKKALIENFVSGINEIEDVFAEWKSFIAEEKEKALKEIIETENLKEKETREYISHCFMNGEVKTIGTDLDEILPPLPLFDVNKTRSKKRKSVLKKITEFFNKFFGL